jgi:hypothetical protein
MSFDLVPTENQEIENEENTCWFCHTCMCQKIAFEMRQVRGVTHFRKCKCNIDEFAILVFQRLIVATLISVTIGTSLMRPRFLLSTKCIDPRHWFRAFSSSHFEC